MLLLNEIVNNILSDKDLEYSVDIETSANTAFDVDSYITVIALSYIGDDGFNVSWGMNTGCNKFNTELPEAWVYEFTRLFDVSASRCFAYNCSFEIGHFWRHLGKFYEIQDTYMTAKMAGLNGGLKKICVDQLGLDARWDEKLTNIKDTYSKILQISNQARVKLKYSEAIEAKDIELLKECSSKLSECIEILNHLEIVDDEILHQLYYHNNSWAMIDNKILTPYCIKDTEYTIMLQKKLRTDAMSKGYTIYLNNQYLGAKLNNHGYSWDMNKYREMKLHIKSELLYYLKGYIRASYNNMSPEYSIDTEIQLTRELPFEYTYFTPTGKAKIKTVSTEEEYFGWLKGKYGNPGSHSDNYLFWNTYVNETIKSGSILLEFTKALAFFPEQELRVEKEFGPNYKRDDDPATVLEELIKFGSSNGEGEVTKALKRAAGEVNSTYLNGSLDAKVVKFQYKVLTDVLGEDVNNEDTWSNSMRLLVNFFMYKKYAKTLGSLNGAHGLAVVNKVLTPATATTPAIRTADLSGDAPYGYIMNNGWNVCSAQTARWAAASHSLPQGNMVRKVYGTVKEDHLAVISDISGAEYAVCSAISKDEAMYKIISEGKEDLHKITASRIFEKEVKDVTKAERKTAKGVSFGILYGMGVKTLADGSFNGDVDKAQNAMDMFFESFPMIEVMIAKAIEHAEEHEGMVPNLFGGMIDVELSVPNYQSRASNYPLQSTSSLIVGNTGYCVSRDTVSMGSYALSFTHDSISYSTPIDTIFDFFEIMKRDMFENVRKCGIPFSGDIDVSTTYTDWVAMTYSIETTGVKITLEGSKEEVKAVLDKLGTKYVISSLKQEGGSKLTKGSLVGLFTNETALGNSHLDLETVKISAVLTKK
jgi:DNA polymerase I-like protein with 3'-5' exonuclease and polymerase domains